MTGMRRLLGTIVALAGLGGVAGCGIAASDAPDRTLPSVAAPTLASPVGSPTAAVTGEAPFIRPSVAPAALLARFAYDATAPLAVTRSMTENTERVVTTTITYAVPGGPPVSALVIAPVDATHRHPGVVFAHGGAPGADVFRIEAGILTAKGIVSILPDIPMTITGDAKADLAYVTRAVIAERRALDVLAARPDVDPTRLAFVGHSWGADLATIMAGVDRRLVAVVVACARSRVDLDMDTMGTPADRAAYLASVSVLDGDRFVRVAGRRTVLYQWGKLDDSIPPGERDDLMTATAGTKTRDDYAYGHDLVAFPDAVTDRDAYLVKALGAK
jgi:dienelactone hydrolase